ncbi:hypothetical protein BpHYR1_047717 [Brachionus plicatilis]|uniref:Uncharacterized protein n=1 Tax=Brachionus plicatilis TaxID=10195 RepID=A0A3M7P7G9_BRAPC|nr:hypothetical protein BpHYR1_047717 [Brachionus plicatilis]
MVTTTRREESNDILITFNEVKKSRINMPLDFTQLTVGGKGSRSSVYQGYKTVEGQLVSGDAFPKKALLTFRTNSTDLSEFGKILSLNYSLPLIVRLVDEYNRGYTSRFVSISTSLCGCFLTLKSFNWLKEPCSIVRIRQACIHWQGSFILSLNSPVLLVDNIQNFGLHMKKLATSSNQYDHE